MAPRKEEIMAAHNFDHGVVEGLKIAVTNIRSSYAQLKQSQDEKCAQFEKDAEHILNEMDRQDAGADTENVRFPFICPLYLICVLCGLLLNL